MNHQIQLTVNGVERELNVPAGRLLVDCLRYDLGLTGTKEGCGVGVCGACTIMMDGESVRSCLLFAVQADRAEILTVEGLAQGDDMHPLQQAFWDNHALQCGFCTSGFLISAYDLLQKNPHPTQDEIRHGLSGNLCRCTGYATIIKALQAVADQSHS